MMERLVNFLAVLFYTIEGDYMHGKGRISRFAPETCTAIENQLCDWADSYGTDGVFSCDPLPLHWYFFPEATVSRWYDEECGISDDDDTEER
jgi:hypothetical protein